MTIFEEPYKQDFLIENPMKEDLNKEIKQFLKDYHDTYFLNRDLTATLAFYKDSASVIGTGLDEIGFEKELKSLYKRDISQASNRIDYQISSERYQQINSNTILAILTLDIETLIENQLLKLNNLRATFVIDRVENKFLIAHKHISLPTQEHDGDEAYPLKELEERNTVLQRLVDEKTRELKNTIDELKAAQENLEEMNREKDKFFSIVAHDIKSPFNTLLGFTDLLANSDRIYDEDKLKKIHLNLYQSTKKTHILLENLLEWAGTQMRKSHINIKKISPHIIVNEVVALFQSTYQEKEIFIINEIDKEQKCLADENILKLILRNLISNAIKFSHNKSQIIIYNQDVESKDTKTKDVMKIIIKDFGVGMSQESIKGLFNLSSSFSTYGTNNESGNGLGLIFTKDMVSCLNGEISVQSEEGRGTEMAFTLPKAT